MIRFDTYQKVLPGTIIPAEQQRKPPTGYLQQYNATDVTNVIIKNLSEVLGEKLRV